MKVLVTGADGFLGARVVDALLGAEAPVQVTSVVAVDVRAPAARPDPRVTRRALDLTASGAAAALVTPDTRLVLHLAAVVSGEAERDFDLGMRVNLDGTRALLEAVRHVAPAARFVFVSTVGVYGGEPSTMTGPVDERTAPTPRTSYGAAKAAAELLVCDYTRRGFVDGVAVRLPTVTVRAGVPNAAVTGFASGVVREPLHGVECVVPVPADTELWVSSPRAVVANLLRAASISREELPAWRALCLPGLRVSVRDMVSALRSVGGETAARLVSYRPEPEATRMVTSFPTQVDASLALSLGFERDPDFEAIVRDYMREINLKPLS